MSALSPSKVDAYFDIIDAHVICPIKNTDLSQSCIATLVLIFASIDGLGKLTHPKASAGAGERFKYFLTIYFDSSYSLHQDQIYDLRNELVHNALNVSSFMSKTWMGQTHHLQKTALGFLFISSGKLFDDFCIAVQNLKYKLQSDVGLRNEAERRLKVVIEDPSTFWGAGTTRPGPVEFVIT